MNSSNSINISSGDGLEFRSCSLNQDGISRYGRQLILRGWGVEAQQRLSTARILIVGAGGLGCPCALYLASAGVGSLGICDYDSIERSNLHRQIAHQDQAVGTSKAESLVRACRDLNPTVAYQLHQERFEIANAKQLLRQYDMVVDATDNVPTRYTYSKYPSTFRRICECRFIFPLMIILKTGLVLLSRLLILLRLYTIRRRT